MTSGVNQNDDHRWSHNLEHHSDNYRVENYNRNLFIVQATGVNVIIHLTNLKN